MAASWKVQVTYFDRTSDDDPEGVTEEALKLARKRAEELGIRRFVIASTRGFVAKKALALLGDKALVFVGIARDSYEKGFLEELAEGGVPVVFSDEVEYEYPPEVQTAYRRMGEGVKVCPEVVMIAADKGLIPEGEEVFALAGSDRGADTAMVIAAAKSANFRRLRIKELICKPR